MHHRIRRHQLVRLSEAGWRDVLAEAAGSALRWDVQALGCLNHWAYHHLPLVVTRQPADASHAPTGDRVALGLPAPERWGRRRIALSVPVAALHYFDELPSAATIAGALPRRVRAAWRALCAAIDREGVSARVGGSYGWQQLSGLPCVHAQSDLDLVLAPDTEEAADRIAALLQHVPFDRPRLDGELVFPDGSAVAWREWAAWRAGRVAHVLVKRLRGVALEDSRSWRQPAAA